MKLPSLRSCALALIVAAASLHSTASAQTATIIDRLPYFINTSGLYVLNSNLSSTQVGGALISVGANNVTIDFQGHFIAGPASGTNQVNYGVNAYEKSNLTVRNGTVAFCLQGIYIYGQGGANTNSVNHQIDNMRVTYCLAQGIVVQSSPGSRITNCQVSQTGQSNVSPNYGINVGGTGVLVQGNVVGTVIGSGSLGINASTGCFVRQNTISDSSIGVQGGKYQDNLTSGCTTPFTGGVDAGGNN